MSRGPAARLSVLHVLAPAAYGGLEAVVEALAMESAGSRVVASVAAIIPGTAGHPFLAGLRAAAVPAFPIVVAPRAYLQERAALAELCERLRPDVVHTHGYRADVVDAGVARRLGIPVVTTVHGFTGGGWRNRCYEWLQLRAFHRCDAVVAVSRPLAQRLSRSGVPAERVHVIPNAWRAAAPPLDRAAARQVLGVPSRRDHFCIGWVGRLSDEKGPALLLDALARLPVFPWTACVVGEGPARRALEARAARLGLGERVRWYGGVAGARRLYPAFDVFVLSSRTEGTPVVLFEAMAADVPIVATSVGGVPDVVSGTEAVLVAPGEPRALAAGIWAVYCDAAAAARRASAARVRLEREFDVERWLARYEAVYRTVRAGAPTSRPGPA